MCVSKQLLVGLLLAYTIADLTTSISNEPTCFYNPSSFFFKNSRGNGGVCRINSYTEDSNNVSVTGMLVIHLGKFEKREASFAFEKHGRHPSRVRYSGNILDDDFSLELDFGHAFGEGPGFAVTGYTMINEEKNRIDVSGVEKQLVACHGDECLTANYETEESPLHFEVPSAGPIKSSAVQKLSKISLKGKRFSGKAEWRDVCKQFSEDERGCSGELEAIFHNVFWKFQRESEWLKDSYKLQFSLTRGGTFAARGQFSSITERNETRMELTVSIPDFFDLKINLTSIHSLWKVHLVGTHPRLRYKLESCSEFAATETGISLSHLTSLSNSTSLLAAYRLGFSKSGPNMDIRHNLTSDYYEFESNMTVTQLADNLTKTLITQRAVSPIWDFLNLTLKQVFFSQGDLNWETVVMKNTITNMHVTGKWIDSIFKFYDKTFQFVSNNENDFPSLNVKLDYSDFSRFSNVFHFPLLARKLEALLTLDKNQVFPVIFTLDDSDQFEPAEMNLIDFEVTKNLSDYQAFCDVNVDQIEDLFDPVIDKLSKVLKPLSDLWAWANNFKGFPEMQLFVDTWDLIFLQQSFTLADLKAIS